MSDVVKISSTGIAIDAAHGRGRLEGMAYPGMIGMDILTSHAEVCVNFSNDAAIQLAEWILANIKNASEV